MISLNQLKNIFRSDLFGAFALFILYLIIINTNSSNDIIDETFWTKEYTIDYSVPTESIEWSDTRGKLDTCTTNQESWSIVSGWNTNTVAWGK